MNFGKSIRIFLIDGTVTGIRIGEIINQTIKAIACPRNRLSELQLIEDVNKPGIYFLFGIDALTGEPKVYIGESENILKRLKEQELGKDFWNEVIFFINKDDNLTKSHIRYLENRVIRITKELKRYACDNSNLSNSTSLPKADTDAMEEFLMYTKLLLGIYGHKFLEELTELPNETKNSIVEKVSNTLVEQSQNSINQKNIELFLQVGPFKARGLRTDEGLVVLENSEAASDTDIKQSLQNGYRTIRDKLIKNGTLVKNGNKFTFIKKHLFDSPSPAAAIIVGYSINGREHWKDKNGNSLKSIEEKEINT